MILAMVALLPGTALGVSYTLSDGNSSVSFDPSSAAGVNNWTVDGANQLNQDWFFFRVGNSGPIVSIDTIGAPTVNQSLPSQLDTTYANAQVSIRITYSLIGGAVGSGNSQLAVAISVQNLSPGAVSFFNYADFSLGGSPNTVTMGKNLGGLFNEANVSGANSALNQTLATPGAPFGEAALYNATLSEFAAGTALSGNLTAGPGHVTYAFGWSVDPGGNLVLSTVSDLHAVPDHGEWYLIWIALGACFLMRHYLPRAELRFAQRPVDCRD